LCYLNGEWLVGRLVACEKGSLFQILLLTVLSAFVKKDSLPLCLHLSVTQAQVRSKARQQ